MQGFTRQVPIDTDINLTNNSDILVASQKATKTYIDNKSNNQVPITRTITINGETHDLSANQTFTVTSGLSQQQILAINTFRI